jgi:hypothetical protein
MSQGKQDQVRMTLTLVNAPISDENIREQLSKTHALVLLDDGDFQKGIRILRKIKAQVEKNEVAWKLLVHDAIRRECQWYDFDLDEYFPNLLDPVVMQRGSIVLCLLKELGLQKEYRFLDSLADGDDRFFILESIFENSVFFEPQHVKIDHDESAEQAT